MAPVFSPRACLLCVGRRYRALGMEPFERLHEAECVVERGAPPRTRGCLAHRPRCGCAWLIRYRVEIVTPLSAATSAPVFPAPGWDEREYRRRIYASPREQAVAAITGILMLATLVLSVLFVLNRNAVIVKASNHVFCQLMFLAGEILYATAALCRAHPHARVACADVQVRAGRGVARYMAVLVWPIDASDLTCKAFPWLFCVGMMLFLACLVAKNYRICKILHQRFRRVRIRVRQLLTVVFGICLVQVLLLLLWYAVGAPTDMLVVVDPVRPVFNYHDCDSSTDDSEPVTFIIGAYSFIIGLTAVVIAFMSRKAPSECVVAPTPVLPRAAAEVSRRVPLRDGEATGTTRAERLPLQRTTRCWVGFCSLASLHHPWPASQRFAKPGAATAVRAWGGQ